MDLNISEIMKRFTVYENDQLFDIEKDDLFRALKDNRCPKCGNRLKFMRNGKMAYCKGVKHRKTFIIGMDKLNKINGK